MILATYLLTWEADGRIFFWPFPLGLAASQHRQEPFHQRPGIDEKSLCYVVFNNEMMLTSKKWVKWNLCRLKVPFFANIASLFGSHPHLVVYVITTCTCIYIYIHTHVCMYVCMYLSMYLCIYVSMYLCMYVSMYLCIYVCMYVCMYVCVYVCMCVCVYIYIYEQSRKP